MNSISIEQNKKHYHLLLFWGILLFAFIIRFVNIANIPSGINQDEAMGAMDALALSKYGTDRYGMEWPVHFQAWKYSHMSVLLSYCMIPFIKLFGFSTFTIRLPIVFASTMGIALVYLVAKKFFSAEISLAVMAFAAINPWQFMQSRWSLDCNLFPHVFLLAFYLLLCGLEKRRYLYLSMVFFGLTFYCYGIAVYTVPVFLFVYAAWCLWKKELPLRDIIISVAIFFVIALPEILTMVLNMFHLETIQTPFFTIPYFPDSIRSNDILFLNFSFYQLGRNALCMLKQAFLQCPDHIFNTLPAFGAMYHISTPFLFLGIWQFAVRFLNLKKKNEHPIKELFCTRNASRQQTLDLALLGFLIMGIWAGLITYEVNVNRINIIFYPFMFFTIYGIQCTIHWFVTSAVPRFKKRINTAVLCRTLTAVFLTVYAGSAACFFVQYFTTFPQQIRTMFNVDFLSIIKEADASESYDTLYVSSNMGWQTNARMAEILTQYSCQIDALYYQERTTETNGRTLLPYSERYHFVDLEKETDLDTNALYIIHQSDLDTIKAAYTNTYDIVLECGEFLAIDFHESNS